MQNATHNENILVDQYNQILHVYSNHIKAKSNENILPSSLKYLESKKLSKEEIIKRLEENWYPDRYVDIYKNSQQKATPLKGWRKHESQLKR